MDSYHHFVFNWKPLKPIQSVHKYVSRELDSAFQGEKHLKPEYIIWSSNCQRPDLQTL